MFHSRARAGRLGPIVPVGILCLALGGCSRNDEKIGADGASPADGPSALADAGVASETGAAGEIPGGPSVDQGPLATCGAVRACTAACKSDLACAAACVARGTTEARAAHTALETCSKKACPRQEVECRCEVECFAPSACSDLFDVCTEGAADRFCEENCH